MTRVAIVKPDRQADLVLALPAIRALCRHFGADRVTLYLASNTADLAEFLIPGVVRREVDLPHVSGCKARIARPSDLRAELDRYDLVFCLCDDPVLASLIDSLRTGTEPIDGDDGVHETLTHKTAVCRRIPGYSRTAMFTGRQILWPERIDHVGLVLESRDPLTAWPVSNWLELAQGLTAQGIFVSLIGTPEERAAARFVSRALGGRPHEILDLDGGPAQFLGAIADVRLVVATDGFLAHLCSIKTPVISLFGATPWRRSAPFGWSNVVLTTDPACSPCLPTDGGALIGCTTHECISGIAPVDVCAVIASGGVDFSRVSGARVQRGTSHPEASSPMCRPCEAADQRIRAEEREFFALRTMT